MKFDLPSLEEIEQDAESNDFHPLAVTTKTEARPQKNYSLNLELPLTPQAQRDVVIISLASDTKARLLGYNVKGLKPLDCNVISYSPGSKYLLKCWLEGFNKGMEKHTHPQREILWRALGCLGENESLTSLNEEEILDKLGNNRESEKEKQLRHSKMNLSKAKEEYKKFIVKKGLFERERDKFYKEKQEELKDDPEDSAYILNTDMARQAILPLGLEIKKAYPHVEQVYAFPKPLHNFKDLEKLVTVGLANVIWKSLLPVGENKDPRVRKLLEKSLWFSSQ